MSDIKKIKKVYKQYQKMNAPTIHIEHYSDGGDVSPSPTPIKPDVADALKKAVSDPSSQTMSIKDFWNTLTGNKPQGLADGGQPDPVTGTIDPNSPEGLALIANADYPQASKMNQIDIPLEGSKIQADSTKPIPKPASESKVSAENAEDKDLENKMKAEDFEAGEKSDEDQEPSEEDLDKEESDREPSSEDESSFKKLLSALKPQSDLKDAQRQRDQLLASNNMAQGSARLGAGLAGISPDKQISEIEKQRAEAQLPVQKYNELVADQQNDPNSPMSKVVRDYLNKKGLNVPEDASAANLLKVAPFLAKDSALQSALQKTLLTLKSKESEGEKNRESRENVAAESAKQRADQINAYKERTESQIGSTNDRKMQSRFDNLNKALREGGGQPVIQNRLALQRANNLFLTSGVDPKISEKDVDQIPEAQLNKVNKIGVIETGIELNRLLTGAGVPAQGTLDKLIPKNANMTATQVQDYISNNLNPADQAKALKSYMKIAARVRDQSKKNVQDYQKQVLSGSGQVLDYFPEQSKLLLGEHDLSQNDLKGNKSKPSAVGMHNPGDIVSYQGKQYRVGNDGDSLEEIQ